MGTTLTITDVEDFVAQRLRTQAASHGRTVEAEARAILSEAVAFEDCRPVPTPAESRHPNVCDSVRGLWKGRGTTDDLMKITRGED